MLVFVFLLILFKKKLDFKATKTKREGLKYLMHYVAKPLKTPTEQ